MSIESKKENAILLGFIQVVDFHSSIRQLTDGERNLTVEELQKNAQEALDWIADRCTDVLNFYDEKELEPAILEYKAWSDNIKKEKE